MIFEVYRVRCMFLMKVLILLVGIVNFLFGLGSDVVMVCCLGWDESEWVKVVLVMLEIGMFSESVVCMVYVLVFLVLVWLRIMLISGLLVFVLIWCSILVVILIRYDLSLFLFYLVKMLVILVGVLFVLCWMRL